MGVYGVSRLQVRSRGREVDAGQYDVEREREVEARTQAHSDSSPIRWGRAGCCSLDRPAGWLAGLPQLLSLLPAFRHANANAHLTYYYCTCTVDASHISDLHL